MTAPNISSSSAGPPPADWLAQARLVLAQLQGRVAEAARVWKPPDFGKALGVNVQVDMLGPAAASIRQQYMALPQPVRQVLPYAGTSLLSCAVAGKLHAQQLQAVTQRYGSLRADHDALTAQAAALESQLSEVNLKRTGAFFELQAAEAVAKAATAAAAAATAAATAAQAAAAAAVTRPAEQPAMSQQQVLRPHEQQNPQERRRHLRKRWPPQQQQQQQQQRRGEEEGSGAITMASIGRRVGGSSSSNGSGGSKRLAAWAVPDDDDGALAAAVGDSDSLDFSDLCPADAAAGLMSGTASSELLGSASEGGGGGAEPQQNGDEAPADAGEAESTRWLPWRFL